jgi:hypothetical protein
MIKKMLKNIIVFPFTYYKRKKIVRLINQTESYRVFIFDIDNTIADTLPSLELNHWKNEAERIATLPIFIKMHRLLKILYSNKRNKIYFLTARSYFSYEATYTWLKEMELPVERDEIFITRTAEEKKEIFKEVDLKRLNVYYLDDLAYLASKNNLLLHKDLIEYFQQLSEKKIIKFFGINELEEFIRKTK